MTGIFQTKAIAESLYRRNILIMFYVWSHSALMTLKIVHRSGTVDNILCKVGDNYKVIKLWQSLQWDLNLYIHISEETLTKNYHCFAK